MRVINSGGFVLGLVLSLLGSSGCEKNGPGCPSGTTDCDGTCAVTDSDPANCGTCGHACEANQVCRDGDCASICLGGTTECDGACVDTRFDPSHCGNCATTCGTGEVCSPGGCAVECLGGTTLCGEVCVETQLNPAHCGGCEDGSGDHTCAAGEVCSDGHCGLSCGGTTPRWAGSRSRTGCARRTGASSTSRAPSNPRRDRTPDAASRLCATSLGSSSRPTALRAWKSFAAAITTRPSPEPKS